ncbi:MAG: histidine kinase dimerization/phospho-acceptor domain-containing protein, partial [Gammaproteobacteria bacterium]
MLQPWVVFAVSLIYLGVLFAIAWWGDRRADEGRSLIASPTVYALSLAVYCTSWTYYGSVGRAAASGVGFLPIYLGPTLIVLMWPFLLRKMIRISRANRITSIADFISTRYGKSQLLGGQVTIIAVIGIAPYIGLQLKAISTTSNLLLQYPDIQMAAERPALWQDTALYITLALAAFTILFGTRHLDATERHEGMVAAIAFESIVKLVAFMAVGLFVTFGLYDGFGDIFSRAAQDPELTRLMDIQGGLGGYESWFTLTLLAMIAVMFLPRQFQVAVVENVDERHIHRAIWLFPLYLLLINIFVLPIAFGGLMHFGDSGVSADTFVLTLPMSNELGTLTLFAFIGGLSAATGMIIVETIALSIMVSNDLVMPVLFRLRRLGLSEHPDLSGILLTIRRATILAVLLLGYLYFRMAGEAKTLVSLGLISFAAVAQFAPAMIAAMYWRKASRLGALAGLAGGFAVWFYTLLLPSFAKAGVIPEHFLEAGPFGIELLRPTALLGLDQLGEISHALFWSLMVNIGLLVWVSLAFRRDLMDSTQAALYVDIFHRVEGESPARLWRGSASLDDVETLLGRFLGPAKARQALVSYARAQGLGSREQLVADSLLVQHAERLLAGSIGGASARVMLASVVKEEPMTMDEVLEILDEASQVIVYSRKLEAKSQELEAASAELRAANERLQELDRMKDEFVSTVSHELRTPLTSIRAFSEILRDNPELDADDRGKYLGIVVSEAERLTRLINQILDLSKLEADRGDFEDVELDLRELIEAACENSSTLFESRGVDLRTKLDPVPPLLADRDRMMQVVVNLLSNAAKFCPGGTG